MAEATTRDNELMLKVARQLFMPCILLVNYTLLQYLLMFYWHRRREIRVALLFSVGFLGVLCLIPFASSDESLTGSLNDVSESCSVLTFLTQITIIGRDLNKKIKFKTVLFLTYAAELLIALDLAMVLFSLLYTVEPHWLGATGQHLRDDLPNVFENITLAFIFVFRFYYIIQSRGWRELHKKRKVEITWYLLFALHEVPFEIIQTATHVDCEYPQALWHRITLAGCLWVTAKSKLRSRSSVNSRVSSAYTPQSATNRDSVGRMKKMNVSVSRVGSIGKYAATARTESNSAVVNEDAS